MSDLILSAAMDSFLAEEDPANVFLPLAGGTMESGADINFANGSRLREGLTDAGNGGAGGVAMVCSLDYEFKWEAGRLYVMEQDGFTIRVEQYGFTAAPTASDDDTKGYVVGSRRILDDGTVYLCTDATTDAAVWAYQGLLDIAGSASINQDTRQLIDSIGNPIFDWENYILNDNAAKSIDLSYRQLFASNGGQVMLDWSNPYGINIPTGVYLGVDMIFDADIPQRYIDVENGVLGDYNSTTIPSVDWQNRYLYDPSGNFITAYWGLCELWDITTGFKSLDWNARQLFGADGTTVMVDWDNRYLCYDEAGNISVNWGTGNLSSPVDGSISVRWADRQLIDSSDTAISIDWENRQLLAADGTTVVADWNAYLVNFSNGIKLGAGGTGIYDYNDLWALDPNDRQLIDVNGWSALKWGNRQLIGTDGTTVVAGWGSGSHFETNAIYGIGSSTGVDLVSAELEYNNYASLNWQYRQLFASDGTTVAADWSTGTPAFAQGASYTPTAYASLPPSPVEGTVCYVNDADSPFSLGSVVTSGGTGKILACFDGTDWRIIAHFA